MDRSRRKRKNRSPWAALAWVPQGLILTVGLALGPFGLFYLGVGLILVLVIPRSLWTVRAAFGGLASGAGLVTAAFGISQFGEPQIGDQSPLGILVIGLLFLAFGIGLAAWSGTTLSLDPESATDEQEVQGPAPRR